LYICLIIKFCNPNTETQIMNNFVIKIRPTKKKAGVNCCLFYWRRM